jgi:hypothetical protein
MDDEPRVERSGQAVAVAIAILTAGAVLLAAAILALVLR